MSLPFRSVCHTDAKDPVVQSVSSWPSVCKEHGFHCVRERYINSTQRQGIYLESRRFEWLAVHSCPQNFCVSTHKIHVDISIYISLYIYQFFWVKGVFRNVIIVGNYGATRRLEILFSLLIVRGLCLCNISKPWLSYGHSQFAPVWHFMMLYCHLIL